MLLIYILLKMTRSNTFFAPVPMIMIGMWFLKPHNTFHVRIWRHINRMIYWNNNQAINFHFYIYFTTCLTNYTITIFVTLHYFWCICNIPYHYLTTGTRVICKLNVNSEKHITKQQGKLLVMMASNFVKLHAFLMKQLYYFYCAILANWFESMKYKKIS